MYNILETLVCICAVCDGKIQVLLSKKDEEPYKNYWILPSSILSEKESLEECAKRIVIDNTATSSLFLMQGETFSNVDRDPNERIIGCTFTSLTDKSIVRINDKCEWFDVNKLPKLAYDHRDIIKVNMCKLNHKILRNENGILFKLFPSDFTLSELQTFFEYVVGEKLDRRNFRRKVISKNIVVGTEMENIGACGRPAKLYKLNEEVLK